MSVMGSRRFVREVSACFWKTPLFCLERNSENLKEAETAEQYFVLLHLQWPVTHVPFFLVILVSCIPLFS